MALDSRKIFKKTQFLTMHSFFMLFSSQYHEASTMVGLKKFSDII